MSLRKPRLDQMSLPELARVIGDGNVRGQQSASFLFADRLREMAKTGQSLDEPDAQGQTAAQVLMPFTHDLAVEALMHLVRLGAKQPEGVAWAMVEAVNSTNFVRGYALMDTWETCQAQGRALIPERDGNLLHFLMQKPEIFWNMHNYIGSLSGDWTKEVKTTWYAWTRQERARDNKHPVHLVWEHLGERSANDEPDRFHQYRLLVGVILAARALDHGASIARIDENGASVASMIRASGVLVEESKLTNALGPDAAVRFAAEVERAILQGHTPSSGASSARMRL